MSTHNGPGQSVPSENFGKFVQQVGRSSESSVISSLYCLSDSKAGDLNIPDNITPFQQAFQDLLPALNFTSTCYLLTDEKPGDTSLIHPVLEKIRLYLKQNTFLQLTFRPVHSFSLEDSQAWLKAYQQFLTVCRPFQEEGYREQIIARLRVFPIIFFPRVNDVDAALPFLNFLKKNFFLPSILFPQSDADEIASLNALELGHAWERIYLTETTSFAPPKILDTLIAHQLFDLLVEDENGELLSDNLFCQDSLVLDFQGGIKPCQKGEGDPSACNHCLLQMMEQAGTCFRLNQQGQTWDEICDRIAGRFLQNRLKSVIIWGFASSDGETTSKQPIDFSKQSSWVLRTR